ncbi:HopJ type III effector protein [Thalassotalea psychrophila]|uniref:HopJ type III effector protein n=1 Tax=Thalassotalea psychrophila TaxID=3065647 RepID=A0ABY9TWR9_9GAMM|nr:HopJ type III effector protein [Colwelliaceae bacterium SQ149]
MNNENPMPLSTFLQQLKTSPKTIEFNDVMNIINECYIYTPVTFTNGELINSAGTNEGSCKIFSFALLNNLNEKQTLACFGKFYREDVLLYPNADDHGNIRTFIKLGWEGISFSSAALILR